METSASTCVSNGIKHAGLSRKSGLHVLNLTKCNRCASEWGPRSRLPSPVSQKTARTYVTGGVSPV